MLRKGTNHRGGNPASVRNEYFFRRTINYDYAVAAVNLDCQSVYLDDHWDNLTALKKKYGDKVIATDPGKIGTIRNSISSYTTGRTKLGYSSAVKIELISDTLNLLFKIKTSL